MEKMLELIVRQGTKTPKTKRNEDMKIVDKRNNIFIVADGIGGHPSPEKASQIAALSCYQKFKEQLSTSNIQILDYIHTAMGYANNVLCSLSDTLDEFRNDERRAGTTLDICYFFSPTLYIGHIGDGRVYLLRNSKLKQLTQDHTSISQTSGEASNKLKEYYSLLPLQRYIGDPTDFNPELISINLKNEDIVLMTTDGLTKMLFDEEIARTISKRSFNRSARRLLKAANTPTKLVKYLAETRELSYKEALQKLPNDDDITLVLFKVRQV